MTAGGRELPPLGHVGYIVEDAEQSAEAFRRVLGIRDFRIYDYVPLRAWVEGKDLRPCALRIALGSLAGGPRVELVQPVQGATPHARFLAE
jgi:hypothetical protein